MSSFAFFLICVQACLHQAVYGCGSCGGSASGARGWAATSSGAPSAWSATTYNAPSAFIAASPAALPLAASSSLLLPEAFTATGTGYTAAAGELPIAGSTLVAGRVPVSGAAIFNDNVWAVGSVSIAGNCGYLYDAPAHAAPAYAAPALSPAVNIAAAPALAPAINFAAAPWLAAGPAASPKSCGCN